MGGNEVKRTAVLLSRENFVWHSMQEIIPMIERSWRDAAQAGRHEVRVIDVDASRLSDYLAVLLEADNIVFTCFTFKLARIGQILREEFRLEARYFIYLHSQATIACWPYHVYGMGNCFRTDDVFLSASTRDARSLGLAFTNARVEVLPFTLPDVAEFSAAATVTPPASEQVPFVYVGRISAQKNLHLLLKAFQIFLEREPQYRENLWLYGGEDHLGSPNMGRRETGYLAYLQDLSGRLGIRERVRFTGHLPRAEVLRKLAAAPHVFVSPSLHSDENFGMAALRSLCLGNPAALSAWGGHADFANAFPGRVFLAPVHGNGTGPWLSSTTFANAMVDALRVASVRPAPEIPATHQPERISERIRELALEPYIPGTSLIPTEIAMAVLRKREHYSRLDPPDPVRIFDSYADPHAQDFFRAYGMKRSTETPEHPQVLELLPWGRLDRDRIQVRDPHRGDFQFPLEETGVFLVTDQGNMSARVSGALATQLLREGWALRVETRI